MFLSVLALRSEHRKKREPWDCFTNTAEKANEIAFIFSETFSFSIRVPPGCSTELSHRGQSFLTKLFERYDRDKDGALSPNEMSNLFSCCPLPPWGSDFSLTVSTNSKVCEPSTRHIFALESFRFFLPRKCR